jgi:hypothetical protein
MPSLLAYRFFVDPLPIHAYWAWLIVPLCLLFSIVYKTVKVENFGELPQQIISGTMWILIGMSAAAAVLAVIVKVL